MMRKYAAGSSLAGILDLIVKRRSRRTLRDQAAICLKPFFLLFAGLPPHPFAEIRITGASAFSRTVALRLQTPAAFAIILGAALDFPRLGG